MVEAFGFHVLELCSHPTFRADASQTCQRVMTEALQNHTPRTIVVDEISNGLEARACVDIKAR